MSESARVIIEVSAGVIPGTAEPQFTRRWGITSAEWEKAVADDAELLEHGDEGHAFAVALLLASRAAVADEYARLLRNPNRFNFVRTDWLWL